MLKMSATFTLPKVYTDVKCILLHIHYSKRQIRCKKSYTTQLISLRLDYRRKFLLCISRIISWWNIIFCMCHNKISQSFKSTAFFVKSVIHWNQLDEEIVHAKTVESFKKPSNTDDRFSLSRWVKTSKWYLRRINTDTAVQWGDIWAKPEVMNVNKYIRTEWKINNFF